MGYISDELIDKIWSIFLEKQYAINRQLEESEKKYYQRVEETKRLIKESEDKFFRQMEERNKRIREITTDDKPENDSDDTAKTRRKKRSSLKQSFDDLKKYVFYPVIIKHFSDRGYHFDDISLGDRLVFDSKNNSWMKFGITMENFHYIIVVELIDNPKSFDIDEQINKLKLFREHRNKYNDHRKILGVIAGTDFKNTDKNTILENGFFLFEQSEEEIKPDIPDEFVPSEW